MGRLKFKVHRRQPVRPSLKQSNPNEDFVLEMFEVQRARDRARCPCLRDGHTEEVQWSPG